jgi:hypothetical protein
MDIVCCQESLCQDPHSHRLTRNRIQPLAKKSFPVQQVDNRAGREDEAARHEEYRKEQPEDEDDGTYLEQQVSLSPPFCTHRCILLPAA